MTARDVAQDGEATVLTGFGPFVVLFGQCRPDEADQGGLVGKDAHYVGAPAALLVQAFLDIVAPDPARIRWERGDRQQIRPSRSR